MTPKQLTIYCSALGISVLLSVAYAYWLDHIHDHYVPDWLVVVVSIGVGAILDTLFILENQFGMPLTSPRVLYISLAWGAPIWIWQIGQWSQRKKVRQELQHALER